MGREGEKETALAVVLECVHHCLTAQKLCSHDSTCSALFYFVNKNCGNISNSTDVCAVKDALSCKAALKTLQNHKLFENPCICTDDASHLGLQCHQLFNYIFKNPCLEVPEKDASSDLFDDVLKAPSCNFAFKLCSENHKCKRIVDHFRHHCPIRDKICIPANRVACEEAVSGIQLTPMYGCACWTNDERCLKIYHLVNNSCTAEFQTNQQEKLIPQRILDMWKTLPPSTTPSSSRYIPEVEQHPGPSRGIITSKNKPANSFFPSNSEQKINKVILPPQDSAHMPFPITCSGAQKSCEEDETCNLLLVNITIACEDNVAVCNRSNCMTAIRHFYHLGSKGKTQDVAFCSCRHEDETCLKSRNRLHPICATYMPSSKPSCDEIVESCKRRDDCRNRLHKFDEACAVDKHTVKCQSSSKECREALLGILGTPLRTSCACYGNNIIALYKCTEWQRFLWLNPCVVQAQKEYEDERMNAIPHPPRNGAFHLTTRRPSLDDKEENYPYFSPPPGDNSMATPATFTRPPQLTPPEPTTPKFCSVGPKESEVKIPYGTDMRIFSIEDPSCSLICVCDEMGIRICKNVPCDAKIPCKTETAVYGHSTPAYQAYRGRCICHSGQFICMRPRPQLYSLRQGVYLFLGYSHFEEKNVFPITQKSVTNSIKRIQELVNESPKNTSGAICKLIQYKHIEDNLVLQAILEENEDEWKNNSVSERIVQKDKANCLNPLKYITELINNNDPIVRNDPTMTLFRLSDVEVILRESSRSCSTIFSSHLPNCFTLTSLPFLLSVYLFSFL
ncbi:hypothetical protein CHUAL_009440 [Chamberlinius hualienensis]